MNRLLNSLDKAASAQRLSTVWRAHDSKMICLSPQHAAGGMVILLVDAHYDICASPFICPGSPTRKARNSP